MIDYQGLWQALDDTPLTAWQEALQQPLNRVLDPASHGDLPDWYAALERLPPISPSNIDLSADRLCIGRAKDCDDAARTLLRERLMAFQPWRKGPFELFGLTIDTEWRSDWKWNRIKDHLDLRGRRVLDVGCGNGYYGWRMIGAGAELILGVDPTLRFVMQYAALRHYIGETGNYVLPLRFEQLPEDSAAFDTAFSMGVLYHRKDPQEHLARLRGHLKPGGQLLLEGLVIEGGPDDVLYLEPKDRYAKMRNVHAIPSVPALENWLREAGFRDIHCLDVTATSTQEQRRTAWMRFESLADFLSPDDPTRTIEGHPAPIRACISALR